MWRGHLKSLATKISETENELKLFLQRGRSQPVTLTATPPENEDIDSEPSGTRLLTHVILLLFGTVVPGRCGCIRYKHLWVPAGEIQPFFLPENKMLLSSSLVCFANKQ